MKNGTDPNPYQEVQENYETWLRKYWEGLPNTLKRPDFRFAAMQYADCRRTLDQEFLNEYGLKLQKDVNRR